MEVKLAEFFIALSVFFSITIVASNRLFLGIKSYAMQSLSIAVATALIASIEGISHLYISAVLMFVIKVCLIPFLLFYITKKLNVRRKIETNVSIFDSVIFCALVVVFSYFLVSKFNISSKVLGFNVIPLSISVVIVGLFIMITRRKAITQILGFLTLENGIFMAEIASTHGMPVFVELGIFMDVLIGAIIAGIFTYRMSETFEDIDTGKLSNFKE
jgi:hydrogenase-4 component E